MIRMLEPGLMTTVQDRVDNRPKPTRPLREIFKIGVLLRFHFG